MTEPEAPSISPERVEKAQKQIEEMCVQAFQQGYAEGVKFGFEVATEELLNKSKKITLA